MTGHPGWLCLGGAEIVNQERVSTYAQNLGCSGATIKNCDSCGPEMAVALEDLGGAYTNPVTDAAPWYSATEPESADFAGFYALNISGLQPGDISRTSTARATGRGAFLGPETQANTAVVVTGLLLGKTPCAVAYGYRWLRMTLRGAACSDGCTGEDLSFLDCCPTWGADPVTEIEPHLRTLKGVQLISSPQITGQFGDSCACHESAGMLQVTFTLSGGPCVFRPPVAAVTDVPFDLLNPLPCEPWVFIGEGDECPEDTACDPPDDCIADPYCPPPPAPPTPPAPVNDCICEPMEKVQACATIDSSLIPEFADGVPITTIKAGSQDLRQIRMTFIANPFNQPVDDLDPCTACGEVTLSRIPAGAEFVMDGTTNTVTINCPGSGPTDATPLLGSTGGELPFRFPEIECGGIAYVVCVTADSVTAAADASVSVSIAVREC